ncbi:MAG: SAM-dependent methyltransferase [Emergencia sp.]|uniref:DUF5714 domain-containing protein n=1 Tax=Emergencia sp. JLR.KK010 TaxID=3114296 RepID=UPI00217099A2|nr:SAM-dependent methyltransferase [Emergencia sp.]
MAFIMKDEVFTDMRAVCKKIYEEGKNLKADEALMKLMNMEGMPMHCPYHHFIMPAALLCIAAIQEGKSWEELDNWLVLTEERAKTVPPGFCGNCGTCGAAVGIGIFISVYTGASPLSVENWQWANEGTGKSLIAISKYPGPRCCKRTSFLAAQEGVPYINEKCGLHMEISDDIKCRYHGKNAQCLEEKCPFYEEDEKEA